jgi:hypothetical protein
MEQKLLIKLETKIIYSPGIARYPSKWQRMVEKTDHTNVDPKLLSQKTNPKHSVMRHEE